MEEGEILVIVLIVFFFLFGIGIGGIIQQNVTDISLDQETADDICKQLLGNETLNVEAHAQNGKLICERPSFDNTQNIIFKENGEDG